MPPPPELTEHSGRFSLWISPRFCQFIPAVLLFLVFILTFFPWTAIAPGGVTLNSQSAWQAAFGSWWTDQTLEKYLADKGILMPFDTLSPSKAGDPGFGVVTFFWLLFFFLAFFLAIAVVAIGFTHRLLPPKIQPYIRWRWPALALALLLGFFFMLLQDAIGFNMERNASAAIERQVRQLDEDARKDASNEPARSRLVAMTRGVLEQAVVRTFWYRCAWWFYFWALVFVFVTMLADLRRPSPRVDLLF